MYLTFNFSLFGIHNGGEKTGDIASIDGEGYLQIRDRSKDVIKSGGEWISSIDLENAVLTNFPDHVQIAAIIGQPHPKWQERPVLIIQLRSGCKNSTIHLLDILQIGKVYMWKSRKCNVSHITIP